MSDFDYYYFELSKSIISEVENLLLRAHRTDIRFVSGGSKFQPLSARSHAKKISTAGFLLTADEKVKLDANATVRDTVGPDRAHVITTADELILLLESELGESLTAPPKKEEVAPPPTPSPTPTPPTQTTQLTKENTTYSPHTQAVSPLTPHYGVNPVISKMETVEPSSGFTQVEETPLVEPIQEETHLPVDDGFGLTLEEEVQVLRADNDRLRRDLKAANINQGSGVSSEQLQNLKEDLDLTKAELESEKSSHNRTRETLQLVEDDFKNKKLEFAKLEVENEDLKAQLKESAVVPTTPLSVPKNVEIYVTASSLDLVPSYQYLLVNLKDTLVIDLSLESIMDTLVRITKRNRVAKWLLGEQNIRSLYSPYDEIKLRVADGLDLLTSPNALLPVNVLSEVDWERKFDDLARLNRPVVLYLGLETNRGVFEFLSRLDKQAKVLRSGSPLSERSWSRVVRQHEGSVEEVSI
jgi:hypothetical protein